MKRSLLALFAVISFVGAGMNSVQAQSEWTEQMYCTDEATGDIYFYDRADGLITDPSQLSSNSEQSAQFGVSNLINPSEDYNTIIWHTSWSNPLATDTYLQIHLNEEHDMLAFAMVGSNWASTYDTPDHVVWYGTNTPEMESSWTQLLDMPDLIPTSQHTVYPAFYSSPVLRFDQPYTDLRMVIKSTVNQRSNKNGNVYTSLARFQMYEPKPIDDPAMLLELYLYEVNDMDFAVGTDPGYYPAEKVEALREALNQTSLASQSATTEEEFRKLLNNLRAVVADVKASLIPVTEGYYRFVNTYPEFENKQDVRKAMYADIEGNLGWENLDVESPYQFFLVKAVSDSTWSIQNVGSGSYIGTMEGRSTRVSMTSDFQTGQVFKFLADGQFNILNTDNIYPYHASGHSSGAGQWGYIVGWAGEMNNPSSWYLCKEVDEDVITALVERSDAGRVDEYVKKAIEEANALIEKMIDYTPVITNAEDGDPGCQLSSNAKEPKEGAFSNLIDGAYNTHFHSIYSQEGPSTGHNLQVDMAKSLDEFFFEFTGRTGGYHDTPSSFDVYVTNDDALGADANSDNDKWTKVDAIDARLENVSEAYYKSPVFKLSQPARYMRMVVTNTTTFSAGRKNNYSGLPYFNLSEFMVYSTEPESTSPYWLINGMSEACDALKAIIAAEEEKLEVGKAEIQDTATIYQAMRDVMALWVDLDEIDSELETAMANAVNALNTAQGLGTVPLLTDGSQITANSAQNGFPASNLLSTSTSYNTIIWHTSWAADKLPAGVDNYLQAHLNESHEAIAFSMIGSSWASTYDTPDDVVIMASNTPDDESSWTEIIEIPDLIPVTQHTVYPARYTSSIIQLGAPYTDVRFVVKKTTNMRNNGNGNILVSLARFQVYGNCDPDDAQYSYIDGMKEAVDALNALYEELKGHTKHTTSQQQVDNLKQLTQNVLDLLVDSKDIESLFATIQTYVDEAEVGESVGYFQTEDPINALKSALEAAEASVNLDRPDPKEMDPATENLNTALDAFLNSYIKLEPNKWYYIINNSPSYEYCKGMPMYSQSATLGECSSFAAYDYGQDPTAIWRFVPIEGTDYYGIQNMGTSHYYGAYRGGRGDPYKPLMTNEPQPYEVKYLGHGSVGMIPADSANIDGYALHAQQMNNSIVLWNANASTFSASCWTMLPADPELLQISVTKNVPYIMTLPYAIPEGDGSVTSLNDEVETFELSNVVQTEDGVLIQLSNKEDFEAGEPFILIAGDVEDYDAESLDTVPVYLSVPQEIVTVAGDANGIYGTLDGTTIENTDLICMQDDKLAIAKGTTSIPGQRGYIDPRQVTDLGNTFTLDILLEGATFTGLQEVLQNTRTWTGDLYSADGKLIKRNATLSDVLRTQQRGLFIIGGQKIYKK